MRTAVLAVAAAILGIAGCGSIAKTSVPASKAAAASASTSATPTPSNSLSGPVGTTYTVADQSGDKMSVTLTRVIDPAQGADQFTTPDNGNRFVGAVVHIAGISSRARSLMEGVTRDLELAGVDVTLKRPSPGTTYLSAFADAVESVLTALRVGQ
jgi:hypothetical protein